MDPGPNVVARATSHRGELVLRRRYDGAREALELRANGVFVMDTAETSSERALAITALDLVRDPGDVLVGGLGLGFTVIAVLEDRRVGRCTVVEIEPALVDWLRDGTVPHGPELLGDPRVEVVVGDVAHHLGAVEGPAYDLVLLDVDNGPGHLVHAANAALYEPSFLAGLRRRLRPGGAVVVWAAERAPELGAALDAGFDLSVEVDCPVTLQGRDEHYWLYAGHVAHG